ncbi:ATP-dependent RNA helicase [Candidatus Uhrbacteria bacterium]|nr:ATP-dependent RNA helicase [Candidatus Uhrbacteria bacterium]
MNELIATLPVLLYGEEIVRMVLNHRALLITAATGAGKSTQVPQLLARAGYRVIVTQPRRLAARTLAQRVAQEMKSRLGAVVGFHTAEERVASAATDVLFCTDGLQLVRELSGAGQTGGKTVLVLDEVHEWNLNMEVLIAWTKSRIAAGDDLRVVIMSATLDAERLAAYFGGVPVIDVPGRLFPVERSSASSRDLVATAVRLGREGRNVLVFQPGKKEIEDTVSSISKELGSSALVLPLHGQLEPHEQQLCFDPPPSGKVKVVVSTNVAQTSVTISDIDAVVDSGVERRIELVDGIEGLYLKPISRADCEQRAGRAGRCKPGVYVLCSDTHLSERPEFPRAEILRSRLDQMVLRLAVQGFDATTLEFFHQPDAATLAAAKKSLIALGAMSSDGQVTKIGRKMAKLPVSVQYARMLIEAERLGVVESVATIAACLEAGEIRARDGSWKQLTMESKSDLLAILDVFNAGKAVKGGGGASKVDVLREQGIFTKDFFRAGEIRGKLLDAVRGSVRSESKRFASKDEERKAILLACVSGMVDHLYSNQGGGEYRNGSAGTRQLARETVVTGRPDWLVGLPFDISGKGARGRSFTLHLVGSASAVDPSMLLEVAPQLGEVKTGLSPRFDAQKDVVVSTTQTYFNGQKIKEEMVADGENPEAAKVFARWLASAGSVQGSVGEILSANAARQKRAGELNARSGEETFKVYSSDELSGFYLTALAGARRIGEIRDVESLRLPSLDEELVEMVVGENPDQIDILGVNLAVEYRSPYYGTVYAPRVKLSEEMVKANAWAKLPDEGIRLPSGRFLMVSISFGWSTTIESSEIPQLKGRVRNHLNQEQWGRWTNRPVLALPDLSAEEPAIPEITISTYGSCVVDGSPLEAFGAVAAAYTYYASDSKFEAKWFASCAEAEEARKGALAKLEEIREELRGQREREKVEAAERVEREAATAEAEAAREELKMLSSHQGWYDISYELHGPVDSRRWAYLPRDSAGIRAWTVETKAITAKVETALRGVAKVKEDAQRAKAEAEAVERSELSAILGIVGVDLRQARNIRIFAEAAARIVGAAEAVRVFRRELTSGYGRGRQQEGVRQAIGTLMYVEGGESFFNLGRASDVYAYLEGASSHLESRRGASPRPSASPASDAGGASFKDEGGRTFRCFCGATVGVTKGQWKAYQAGETLMLDCVNGHTGEVRLATTSSAPSAPKTAETAASDQLAALKAKFGAGKR